MLKSEPMIIPPFLKKGDRIGIAAPARKVNQSDISEGLAVLESWGLEPVSGKNLFNESNQFSGTDEERTSDLQIFLDDPSIKAILFARGGYGTLRIIDELDFGKFISSPKWIAGFSDATVLHSHLQKNYNIASLHSPMLFNLSEEKISSDALETFRSVLFGEKNSFTFDSHPLNRNGNAEGELTGGNLSILYALQNSVSDSDCKGKILFIEDLDEYLYHIDRMMMSLKRAGKLKNLKGMIIGGMTDMKDNMVPFGKTAEEIIRETVDEYDFPVCFGFPAGHISNNHSLILGGNINLQLAEKCTLNYF